MEQSSIPSGPKPSANELTALKMVKHGFAVDNETRRRLIETRLIIRGPGGWALTESGALWDAVG